MRNTHTLTHKSGRLFAHSIWFFLAVIAVGGGLPCQGMTHSTFAPLSNADCTAHRLFLPIRFYASNHSNHASIQHVQTQGIGSFCSQHVGASGARYYQPPTTWKLAVSQHQLVNSTVSLIDAATIHFRSLPIYRLGRARCGIAGRVNRAGSSSFMDSDSGSDDSEQVTARIQFSNPQTVLSRIALIRAIAVSTHGLQAKAFSHDSQVLTAFEVKASSPFQLFSDSGEIRCELHTC